MKIKKHKIVARTPHGDIVTEMFFDTKESAIQSTDIINQYYIFEYVGEVEIDVYCSCCEKDLQYGDEYIAIDLHTRYCSDCFEKETVTNYYVGGEYVGDEYEVEFYDNEECKGE